MLLINQLLLLLTRSLMRVIVDIVSILFEVLSEEIIQVLLVFFEVFP